jgi:hypothetical protein
MLKVFKNVVIKNKVLIGLILVASTLLFFYTKENFEDCENSSTGKDMPDLAKDACNRISSRAEEIEAELKGGAGIVDSLFAFLSPKNYKAGDNKTSSLTRNIINTNLSQCEITKIANTCNQTSTTSQSNSFDNTDCIYCKTNNCKYGNINQSNKSANSQSCTMQAAIKILTEKTNSVDAQALAKVLQKTEGILSGSNTTQTENCNLIANDLSSKKYLETKNDCVVKALVNQSNSFKGCGEFGNIVQKNESKTVQECMIGAEIKSESKTDNDTKVSTTLDVDQLSKGLSLELLAGIGGISSISSSSCFLLLVVIVLGWISSNKQDIKEIIRNN